MKQRIISVLIVALASYIFYLLISPPKPDEISLDSQLTESDPAGFMLADTPDEAPDFYSSDQINENLMRDSSGPATFDRSSITEKDNEATVSGRRLEIFGRVVDDQNQPIVDTLVTAQQYLNSTRTDPEGNYRIYVDMPKYQFPVLRFLRKEYEQKRIQLDIGDLKDKSVLELDVTLDNDADSISIDGWVGNDIGLGLGGLKIQLTTRDSLGLDNEFSTVFSNEQGFFTLEGVRSGDLYDLTIFSPPEYLFYVDESFTVTQNTLRINIVLESLEFVDIVGMIVNGKGAPISNFEIYIRNISTNMHVRKITTDSSGFFSLEKFPVGKVSISTQGPEYFNITGLALSPGEYKNLRLVVDKGDYYLSGWVSDENGVPLAKALVQLNGKILDGPREYLSYRVRGTDSAGRFNFRELGSGAHLITVEASGFDRREITHQFESQSDEIHIVLSRSQ